MKRTALALVATAASLLLGPHVVAGQVFYQYPDAAVIKPGEFVAGPFAAAGDHELFRFGGFARMNATKYLDVGFELLFDSADGDGRFGAGGDVKFSLFPPTSAIPFDLSVTTGIGTITSDAIDIFQFPFGAIISSPFRLDEGNILVPYLGVYMLLVDTDIDTDLDAELRGGVRYTLTAGPDLFVGFHVGRDALVTVGVSFWLKRQG